MVWCVIPLVLWLAMAANPAISIRIPDRPSSESRTAVFAMGSFWAAESAFGCIRGVLRTRVGYSGGIKQNPEYRNIGDHAESVEIEYDPAVVRYEQLLDTFWANHDPTQVFGQGPDVGEQYRSVIFTQGDEEMRLASLSKEREQAKRSDAMVATDIEPFDIIYPAELEHQKFELKRRPMLLQLFGELTEEEFVRSTAATKFNGYAAGTCPLALSKELANLLSQFLRQREKLSQFF